MIYIPYILLLIAVIALSGIVIYVQFFRPGRKQAEEKLRQLSRAVEQSPASIVITNTKGIIEYVNPRFTQVTGYASDEIVGKNPRVLKTDQTSPETHSKLWETLSTGKEWRGEFVNRKKNGELYRESAIISPIVDARGFVTHYLAVKEDITEQRRIQVELQQQNEYLSTLHQITLELLNNHNIPELLQIIVDRAALLLDAPFVEILLEEDDELVVHTFTKNQQALKGDRVARDNARLSWQAFETKQPVFLDDYSTYKDRRDIYSQYALHAVADFPILIRDRCVGILAVGRSQEGYRFNETHIQNGILFTQLVALVLDNTQLYEEAERELAERKQAEEKLRASEERFRSVFENVAIGLYRTTPAGDILLANTTFARMLGCESVEELMRREKDENDVVSGYPRSEFLQIMEGQGEVTGFETYWKRKDGTTLFVLESSKTVRDTNGEILYYEGSVEDITERKLAEDALARHDQEISTLYEASLEINSSSDISSLLNSIVRRACELLKIQSGALYLVRHDEKVLEVVVSHHLPNHWVGIKIHQDQGVAGQVVQTRKPMMLEDYQNWEGRLDIYSDVSIHRILGIPLIIRDQVTGVLILLDEQVGSFSDNDIHLVSLFADQAAIAIEDARLVENLTQANDHLQMNLAEIQNLQTELREQAIHDPLTGLYNRRYLNEVLPRELARAARETYPISFALMDIDHFKKINDSFGHNTGDVILQNLAAQLQKQVRADDIICRYGGEEFLIVLPNVSAEIAFQIAERWRISFQGSSQNINATISCGISEFPTNGMTSEELISMADKAMYQAKATGRNRVVIA